MVNAGVWMRCVQTRDADWLADECKERKKEKEGKKLTGGHGW